MAQPVRLGRRHARLKRLAGEWGMQFCPDDCFRLTLRVAESFPVCGVSDMRVVDLVYGQDGGSHRYIFTAEYTEGVVRTKRRIRRVAMVVESRGRNSSDRETCIVLAPSERSLLDQYRHVRGLIDLPTE